MNYFSANLGVLGISCGEMTKWSQHHPQTLPIADFRLSIGIMSTAQ
jgi:hypothetical protein